LIDCPTDAINLVLLFFNTEVLPGAKREL
jgi:hypothetical protein